MHFHRIGWKKKIQPEISQVSKRFFFGLAFALFESWAHLEVVISNRDQCCGQILLDYHWVASAYFSRQAHYFQHFVSSYSDVQSQLAFRLLLLLRKLKLMLQKSWISLRWDKSLYQCVYDGWASKCLIMPISSNQYNANICFKLLFIYVKAHTPYAGCNPSAPIP